MLTEAGGQVADLALAPGFSVSVRGALVSPSALASGEVVTATVGCTGEVVAVTIDS